MTDHRSLSLWHDTLPADDALTPRPRLAGDVAVDVAIVGAGYTGLWTAHYLLEAEPTIRIAIIEAGIAGFGASGRNGGWVSAILPMALDRIARDHGRDAAIRMQRAMGATVDEVGRASAALGIDCHFAKGGHVELVRNPAQEPRVRAAVRRAAGDGRDGVVWLDADEAAQRARASRLLGAKYDPHCAVIHPARLVRGLAWSVEARGATIFEGSTATAIDPKRVLTDHGTVTADAVIRATEGFTPSLRGHQRTLVPLYSLMIATEPLPDEMWTEIGLAGREAFNDGRRLIIYGQRTADGRLAFGGRGAPYHFASAIRPEFDREPVVHDMLHAALVALFPQVRDARITHRWGGPLGVARDWCCSVGFDRTTGIGWGGGYVGDGVATSNLAGRTLRDLVLGRASDLTTLPWVGHRSRRWEPEPIRWLAIHTALHLPASIDRVEASTGRPERIRSRLLAALTGH
ncbi:MAG: FAD-dependent oxidoreductase [Ilumatobacteraceae bacterium]